MTRAKKEDADEQVKKKSDDADGRDAKVAAKDDDPKVVERTEAGNGNGKGDGSRDAEQAYVESLKRLGLDQDSASKILETWKETGADSPDSLRKLFIRGSLRPLGVSVVQTLLDGGAAAGAFAAAASFGSSTPFPFQFGLEAICYFGAFYFVSNVFFDIATIGALLYSIVQFRTNTEAFMTAMEKIAQRRPDDLGIVGKARAAVDALKVVQALNTISDVLQEKTTIGDGDAKSTLANLSAYLILSRAKEEFNFDPKVFNLTDEEATEIALQFCQYDLNDDGVLETREIGNLCDALGQPLSSDELKTAMELIDTDKSGVIEFDEFVAWWVNKVKPPPDAEPVAAEVSTTTDDS